MERLVHIIDKFTGWVGKAFAWAIMIMTLGIGYEVISRKIYDAEFFGFTPFDFQIFGLQIFYGPTVWAFDISYMMYGALFMMGGAYTLSRNGHVRGDFLYRLWKPRVQALVELVLYFIFFFPGVLALIFAGWKYASRSLGYMEVSVMSPANVPIFQFKMIIVAAGVLLLMQGIAQVCRCILCIRSGEWLQQEEDVEEMESILLKQAAERRGDTLEGSSPILDEAKKTETAADEDTRR